MYVSHLSFDDDIIIFKNGSISSLQLLMAFLRHYKVVSGQLISQPKSSFYVRSGASISCRAIIRYVTGFRQC